MGSQTIAPVSQPAMAGSRRAMVRAVRAWGRVAGVLVALVAMPAAARADAPALHDAAGLQVLDSKQLSPRLVEVHVRTAALPGPASIRILLPADYAAHPRERY